MFFFCPGFSLPVKRGRWESLMVKRSIVIVVSALILMSACVKSEQGEKTGTVAPNFTLEDLDGKAVTLSSFRGKVVLIDFWATWCPPCRESVPAIEKLHKKYGDKGLAVLGVSLDEGEWDKVKAFRADYGMSYTVLKGTDRVEEKYMVRTIPLVVLLDKDGNVRSRFLGAGTEDEIEKEIKALLAEGKT